jgi:gamma-glutamyltranspeptidase
MQDQAALQLLMNHIDFGMNAAQAVSAPRFGTDHFMSSFRQQAPVLGSLYLMPEYDADIVADLKNRGHKVSIRKGSMGSAPVMLHINPDTGMIEAAGDTRARRHAGAY